MHAFRFALWTLSLLIVTKSFAAAAERATVIQDVALAEGGVLLGHALDANGKPVAAAKVVLSQSGQPLATAKADAEGHFKFEALKGGVYEVAAGSVYGVYRLWPANTEPASATRGLLLVMRANVVRGQSGGMDWGGLIRNPWVLSTTAAAGIATPIVMSNDGSASP